MSHPYRQSFMDSREERLNGLHLLRPHLTTPAMAAVISNTPLRLSQSPYRAVHRESNCLRNEFASTQKTRNEIPQPSSLIGGPALPRLANERSYTPMGGLHLGFNTMSAKYHDGRSNTPNKSRGHHLIWRQAEGCWTGQEL